LHRYRPVQSYLPQVAPCSRSADLELLPSALLNCGTKSAMMLMCTRCRDIRKRPNLSTCSLKGRVQAKRVLSAKPRRHCQMSTFCTQDLCWFWLVLARELGQTRDRGVLRGHSASVQLTSAIAILRLHLQSQIARLVQENSICRLAQTDTTDCRCADFIKRERQRLRHGPVRRRVGPATKMLIRGVFSAVFIRSQHSRATNSTPR